MLSTRIEIEQNQDVGLTTLIMSIDLQDYGHVP